jgi:hypothetical protein
VPVGPLPDASSRLGRAAGLFASFKQRLGRSKLSEDSADLRQEVRDRVRRQNSETYVMCSCF